MDELIIDCQSGEATMRTLTPDEVAAREAEAAAQAAIEAAADAERQAAEAQRQADLQTLLDNAATNPLVAAAVRLLGLVPPLPTD